MMAATLCGSPMYMVRGSSLPLPPQGLVGMALSPRPRRCQPLGSALHVQSRVLVGTGRQPAPCASPSPLWLAGPELAPVWHLLPVTVLQCLPVP